MNESRFSFSIAGCYWRTKRESRHCSRALERPCLGGPTVRIANKETAAPHHQPRASSCPDRRERDMLSRKRNRVKSASCLGSRLKAGAAPATCEQGSACDLRQDSAKKKKKKKQKKPRAGQFLRLSRRSASECRKLDDHRQGRCRESAVEQVCLQSLIDRTWRARERSHT